MAEMKERLRCTQRAEVHQISYLELLPNAGFEAYQYAQEKPEITAAGLLYNAPEERMMAYPSRSFSDYARINPYALHVSTIICLMPCII
jgi:hypothetical protein